MIELRQLGKKFNGQWVLQDLDLIIKTGEHLVISGPSGSGKTTLLRLIAGLEEPDSGQIFFQKNLMSEPGWVAEPFNRKLGVVFQSSALWPHLNIAQNILFGIQHLPREESHSRLSRILKDIGLQGFEKRHPGNLSGGEARRVALARALVIDPDWLLLDEPLTNLDTSLKQAMLALILRIIPERTGLIYITHDLLEAEQVGSRQFNLPARNEIKESDDTR